MKFAKPAITLDEQVQLIEQRGIAVPDHAKARHYLAHLNYYRLGAYCLYFESDHPSHRYKPGTKFEDVLNLYVFDRELRLLVLDAVERVEVSIRAQWAYVLSHRHGPHSFMDPGIAKDPRRWQQDIDRLKTDCHKSDETFILHYLKTYNDPELPPLWSVCEIMSLGTLSHWYANLKPMETRTAIAQKYELDQRTLQSFLRHLTHVRNFCAHHSRLWNRRFTVTLQLPKKKPDGLYENFNASIPEERNLYNTLVMLAYMLDIISPDHTWKRRLLELLTTHGISTSAMGFPVDFANRPIWQIGTGDSQ